MPSAPPFPSEKESLATIAVRLLTADAPLQTGARRAIALRLAGLYLRGLQEIETPLDAWDAALVQELDLAKRREIAGAMVASRGAAAVFAALTAAGVRPVALKGLALAERLWPTPWMRPTGDLDVLVEEQEFGTAMAVLARLDFRLEAAGQMENGRWRQEFTAAHVGQVGPGQRIDVHARLFPTMGAGIATRDVLRRAMPASLLGAAIRLLEPGDEILFLVIHAAKHGLIHPKWILDLHAARLAFPRDAWATAADRAVAARATRPFWAVARLLQPSPPLPPESARRLRAPIVVRSMIPHLVRLSREVPLGNPWPRYLLEWLLEDRLSVRLQRVLGALQRKLAAAALRFTPCGLRASAGQLRNQRWLEGSLRGGRSSPVWVRLKGTSMAPSMRPGDLLLVTPLAPGEHLEEGSVYLARRAGYLVAHRLVRRHDDAVVMRGDAMAADDPPVPPSEVLGRVIATHHKRAQTKGGTDGPE